MFDLSLTLKAASLAIIAQQWVRWTVPPARDADRCLSSAGVLGGTAVKSCPPELVRGLGLNFRQLFLINVNSLLM